MKLRQAQDGEEGTGSSVPQQVQLDDSQGFSAACSQSSGTDLSATLTGNSKCRAFQCFATLPFLDFRSLWITLTGASMCK